MVAVVFDATIKFVVKKLAKYVTRHYIFVFQT